VLVISVSQVWHAQQLAQQLSNAPYSSSPTHNMFWYAAISLPG